MTNVATVEAGTQTTNGANARSILDFPPGLHEAVPPSIYYARTPGVASKSILDLVRRSPAHYKAWLGGVEQEPTAAMAFGSAFHMAASEPVVFARRYAVEPDFGDCRKKENKERREAWRAEHEGATLLSGDDARAIDAMVASLRAHPLVGKMIDGASTELTVRWTDAATGLACKGRLDWYIADVSVVVDLKTTEDASPAGFAKSVANYRYHVQDAMYRAGLEAVGCPVDEFLLVAIEKKPPYAIGVYSLDAAARERGLAAMRADLGRLAECIERGEFPGYSEEIVTLELPRWAT